MFNFVNERDPTVKPLKFGKREN